MKKTLVALSVLSAAGVVNAAEVYNNGGVSVSVSGSAEVQLLKDWESTPKLKIENVLKRNSNVLKQNSDEEKETKVVAEEAENISSKFVLAEDTDSRLNLAEGNLTVDASAKLTETLSAISSLSFDIDENKNVENDELYVGLSDADWGTLTLGRQYLISDQDGIGKDYELGYNQYSSTDDHLGAAEEVVKYAYDNGKYYFGISYDLRGNVEQSSDEEYGDTSVIDGRVGLRIDDLDARLYVYTDQKAISNHLYETTAYNLEVEYAFDQALSIAASYGKSDVDKIEDTSVDSNISDTRYAEVAGSYKVNDTTFALGYVYTDEAVKDTETQNIYANVTKQLDDNVKFYAEVGYADEELNEGSHPSIDLAYLAGMEITF